ncbi:phosphatase PAP2 family protein [Accumulibacter sp.]|uniref:phosphatase PAP2 family protein n=1 Tax=Accumulibacter sp. TaxID=2053492 RepID=UPI0025E468D4|nr:phosphatase PAP2 family protein [Accumulibacter sp.]MCM8611753.1 PAP2 family protein [Accumulibacter sp.]MCM8635656.1 PAP2 family protein [Accumulibacter sp.]MCM8639243.1 PAP2 family protein [Accumulibacter sp.]
MSSTLHATGELRQRLESLVKPLLFLGLSAILLLVIGQYTDIDLWLADLHFDPARGLFPWDQSWFGRTFMHIWVKNVLIWAGFLLVAAAVLDLLHPLQRLGAAGRARLRLLALAATLAPMLIRSLKARSAMHCPWGIDRYDGSHPFLRILDAVPPDWPAGQCFPAGHASAGMWLAALAVLWLPHAPRKALLAYAAGTGVGMVLGWVQQMRGQHFLTHTLWTAWLTSAVLVALLAVFSRHLLPAAATARPAGENAGLPAAGNA